MDVFENLRKVLDRHIAGAPSSPHILEILRILFTEEQAALACEMRFAPEPAAWIAAAAGLSEQSAAEMLSAMADKGIIFCREKDGAKGYALLPTIPGLFEFPLMAGAGTPVLDRLAKLWCAYHEEAMGREFAASKTPFARIIAVEKAVAGKNEVMPFDELSAMLEKSRTFAVAHCACRVSVGRCDKPRETCLIFDQAARFLVDRGLAREIGKDEALSVLKKAEEQGLVHTTSNAQDRLSFVCNCCSCCCTILRVMTEQDNPNAFARSRFAARVDESLCTGCGVCAEERCPMQAIDLPDGVAQVREERCIGCGLCVSSCEAGAMSMAPRAGAENPPATTADMGLAVAREKGKLAEFVRMMGR
ncbi:MAG: 4Fe-4S binding protein [Thermodesulfobacteriota bacterium]